LLPADEDEEKDAARLELLGETENSELVMDEELEATQEEPNCSETKSVGSSEPPCKPPYSL